MGRMSDDPRIPVRPGPRVKAAVDEWCRLAERARPLSPESHVIRLLAAADAVDPLRQPGMVTVRADDVIPTLSWALDLLDMYDERLADIDGAEQVYSEIHVAGKAHARAVLATLAGKGETP